MMSDSGREIVPSTVWHDSVKTAFEFNHPDAVVAIAWSPDGRRIGTVDLAQGNNLWDLNTNTRLFRIKKHDFTDNVMAFTPDGKYLIVRALGEDRSESLSILDAKDGNSTRTINGPLPAGDNNRPAMLVLTADGRYLVMQPRHNGSPLVVYDTSDWSVAKTADRLFPGVIAASPDSKTLAIAGVIGDIRFCSLPSLTCEEPFQAFPGMRIQALAFSPDGRRLYSAIQNTVGPPPFEFDNETLQLAKHRMIRVFDVATHSQVGAVEGVFPKGIYGLAVHPDGDVLAVAAGSGEGFLVDTHDFSIIQKLIVPGGNMHAVAFSPEGDLLAFGNHQGLSIFQPVNAK